MDIAERIRRARLVQVLCAVLGGLASLTALVEYARTHVPAALVTGVLVLLALLLRFRQELSDFLRRHRRDLLFTLLGAVLGGVVISVWPSPSSPERAAPPPSVSFQPPRVDPYEPTPTPDDISETVYRTPSGARYHRATCGYVKGKEIPLPLVEAGEQGLTPCRVCNPPPVP